MQSNFHAKQFSSRSKDPSARRPNKVCDPYGQNGKPLSNLDASSYLPTLDEGWILISSPSSNKTEILSDGQAANYPTAIQKEFYHVSYIDGSRFVSIAAAVAHNNNHYPEIKLERRLMKREKAWRVVSTITCRTETLGGLSSHDFHIAMLIDVEVGRDETNCLFLDDVKSLKKHI